MSMHPEQHTLRATATSTYSHRFTPSALPIYTSSFSLKFVSLGVSETERSGRALFLSTTQDNQGNGCIHRHQRKLSCSPSTRVSSLLESPLNKPFYPSIDLWSKVQSQSFGALQKIMAAFLYHPQKDEKESCFCDFTWAQPFAIDLLLCKVLKMVNFEHFSAHFLSCEVRLLFLLLLLLHRWSFYSLLCFSAGLSKVSCTDFVVKIWFLLFWKKCFNVWEDVWILSRDNEGTCTRPE